MKKRFKGRKRKNHKFIFFTILVLLVLLTFNYIENNFNISLKSNNTINAIFSSGNKFTYIGDKSKNLSDYVYEYIKNNIFNTPTNILKSELSYNLNEAQMVSFSYMENKERPVIYIYNSHQGEKYSREYLEDYNITPDVLMASNMLKDKLDNIGINGVVENSDILAYMKEKGYNHGQSYIASRVYLTRAMEKYPNAKLYIDLHRDSIAHGASVTSINGKKCAKILFVIGLEYNTYQNNLNVVSEINSIIQNKYPSLSRGILKKEGYGVNGVYNQDLASNVILIEIGGNENNIEEVNNTLDLIAEVLGEYINEKK